MQLCLYTCKANAGNGVLLDDMVRRHWQQTQELTIHTDYCELSHCVMASTGTTLSVQVSRSTVLSLYRKLLRQGANFSSFNFR